MECIVTCYLNAMNKNYLYHYRARVEKVYDGDTITVDIDLGLKTVIKGEKLRFNRINAPEMRGDEKEDGTEARDYLRERILGKEIFVETIQDKKGKFGRYIAEVWLEENGALVNMNDELVERGLARYQVY